MSHIKTYLITFKGEFDGNIDIAINSKAGWMFKATKAGKIGKLIYDVGEFILITRDVIGNPNVNDFRILR